MTAEPTAEELDAVLRAADEEAAKLRGIIEAQARNNQRLAQALMLARGSSLVPPEPLDLSPLIALAEKATGLTAAEMRAMASQIAQEPVSPPAPSSTTGECRKRALRAGSPVLHVEHIFDREPRRTQALDAVREFVRDDARGVLVLVGGKGTGKTAASVYMLGHIGGVFLDAGDLLDVAIGNRELWGRLLNARSVVIDDLGTETLGDSGLWLATFNRLFNRLYANKAKTILTTNGIDPEGFSRRYGDRIYDRLRERGRWLYLVGDSMRSAKSQ